MQENSNSESSLSNNSGFSYKSKLIFISSWMTKLWIGVMFSYIIVLLGCIIEITISSIDMTFAVSKNYLIDWVCILFAFLTGLISSYFMYYSFINTKSKFKTLKLKSNVLDGILLFYILIFYTLIIFLTYLLFGIKIQTNNTLFFLAVLWFNIAIGVVQSSTFILNKYYMSKQVKKVKDDENFYLFKWWPNLVYSYFLDKAYFSYNNIDYESNNMFIRNMLSIRNIPSLYEKYKKYLKKINIFKNLMQGLFSFLFSIIVSAIIMILAALFYWIYATSPSGELKDFLIVFWVILLIHSWLYFKFVVLNKFQLIKDDDETDIINLYDVIKFNFIPKNTNSKISEEIWAHWLGLIRKVLLYYSVLNFDKEVSQLICLGTEHNSWFELKILSKVISNQKWLNISIYEL